MTRCDNIERDRRHNNNEGDRRHNNNEGDYTDLGIKGIGFEIVLCMQGGRSTGRQDPIPVIP